MTAQLLANGRLQAELRTVAGVPVWTMTAKAIRAFQRARPIGVDLLGRQHHWHDPEWVRRQALDRGWAASRAAARGISVSDALDEIVAAVRVRTKRPVGRKPSPAYHLEWAAEFDERRGYHERRACAGEPMPSVLRLCLEVALADFLGHPVRWGYDPNDLPREAAARVAYAIKALQNARSK